MNKISFLICIMAVNIIYYLCTPAHVLAKDMLTPENFTEHITLQPVVTKIIKEDDIKIALRDLNLLHGKMAEDGWEIYQIIEYINGGDFEGFLATYRRMSNF